MKKIKISTSCEPYMYSTEDDMTKLKIGDVLEVKFQNKSRVKTAYKGKKVNLLVNNILDYSFYTPYRRIALIPTDKIDTYKQTDVIIVDVTDRYECLMIDLYPCNRTPFAGWKNKIVKLKKIDHIKVSTKTDYTFNDVDVNHTGCWIHIEGLNWVSGISGGEHETDYNLIKDMDYNDVKINGYKYKIDELDKSISEHKYLEHAFRSFIDVEFIHEKETRYVFGIFIKELSEEFHQRLNIIIKWCTDYASNNKYESWNDDKGTYCAFDVIRKNLDYEYFTKLLDTYSQTKRKAIIQNTLDRCNHIKERGF